MENRRSFLRQSGLATAAFIFAKPGDNIQTLPQEWFSPVVSKVKLLYGNLVLQNSEAKAIVHVNNLAFTDAGNTLYRVQKKNGISLGFINGGSINREAKQKAEMIQLVNSTADLLKKQGCQLIAFVEDPTYTGKTHCEMLASHSRHIDVFFSKELSQPYITQRIILNRKGHETVLSYLPGKIQKATAISFGFGVDGKKNFFDTGHHA